MKNIIFIVCLAFTVNTSIAQRQSREKVKALKIAYITEQLDLNSKEAEAFWPVYNKHHEIEHALKKQRHNSFKTIKDSQTATTMSESEALDLINNYLANEEQKFKARQKKIEELKKVLSNKKIIKLIKAEVDFNRHLVKQLRNRKDRRKSK